MNSNEKSFLLLGSHPCMDFVNTRKNRKGVRIEMFESFSNVLDWFQASGLLDEDELVKAREWETSPKWQGSLNNNTASITSLRNQLEDELSHRVLQGRPISPEFLAVLNDWQRSYTNYTETVPIQDNEEITNGAPTYRIQRIIVPEAGPQQLQAWVADLISDFLCTQNLQLIHQCENPSCILFFYDNSKNRKRRWCSMKTCGNRMKAAEFYHKKKMDNA
jgi:predicted RNA-binding Zn ribbon-like protein